MVRQFWANFTWIDFGVLIIVVRGCWIGFQKGLMVEVFKSVSLVIAAVLGLHFYRQCGDTLGNVLQFLKPVAHICSYILLIGVTVGIARIARDGMVILLRDKEGEELFVSKIAGLVLGFGRSVLISSLLLVGCLVADNARLAQTVRHSFTVPSVLSLSPRLYIRAYALMVKPFFPKEKRNERIAELAKFQERSFD